MLRFSGFLLLAAALLCGGASALEAGAAKAEITPPVGTPLNGFGDRMGAPSTSVHDPLWARCLYLDDGTTKLFWVTTDLCLINPELRERVLKQAPGEVPREHIILTATHTHNAQGAMCRQLHYRMVAGRYMPEVLELTANGIVAAMRQAYDGRKRAAIGYGTGKQLVLSSNRRVNNGPIDEQIGVLLVEDSDGNPLAVLANFAAHPTSVPEKFAISADYCGYFYNELETLSGAGCVALFANGAEGNQTIGNPERQDGWARTESVGKLLAGRVKEISNKITTGEATLKLNHATPTLPRTLAASLQPEQTVLTTLEINDLAISFFPGEPVVEIGLEMRRRALAMGYAAHMSVGLANDYINYFVPRRFYGQDNYEAAMHFFGPGMEDFFYREFSLLLSRGGPQPELPSPPAPSLREEGGVHFVRLAGTPRDMGLQRGMAFKEALRARYEQQVLVPVENGALLPRDGAWGYWPAFLNPKPIVLPTLAVTSRALLDTMSPELFAEIEGMADAAEMPFDAVWLAQTAHTFLAQNDRAPLYAAPFCTMFALTGDLAGGGLLVGRNLDWDAPEPPVFVEYAPAEVGSPGTELEFAL